MQRMMAFGLFMYCLPEKQKTKEKNPWHWTWKATQLYSKLPVSLCTAQDVHPPGFKLSPHSLHCALLSWRVVLTDFKLIAHALRQIAYTHHTCIDSWGKCCDRAKHLLRVCPCDSRVSKSQQHVKSWVASHLLIAAMLSLVSAAMPDVTVYWEKETDPEKKEDLLNWIVLWISPDKFPTLPPPLSCGVVQHAATPMQTSNTGGRKLSTENKFDNVCFIGQKNIAFMKMKENTDSEGFHFAFQNVPESFRSFYFQYIKVIKIDRHSIAKTNGVAWLRGNVWITKAKIPEEIFWHATDWCQLTLMIPGKSTKTTRCRPGPRTDSEMTSLLTVFPPATLALMRCSISRRKHSS